MLESARQQRQQYRPLKGDTGMGNGRLMYNEGRWPKLCTWSHSPLRPPARLGWPWPWRTCDRVAARGYVECVQRHFLGSHGVITAALGNGGMGWRNGLAGSIGTGFGALQGVIERLFWHFPEILCQVFSDGIPANQYATTK